MAGQASIEVELERLPRVLMRRLLATKLIACGVLLMTVLLLARVSRLPPPGTTFGVGSAYSDEGRLRGQPIRELWAANRPVHAWFTDPQCRPLVTRFTRDHSLPLVYLASFPRSGNTWTRYLLETSTGLFTTGDSGPKYKYYKTDPFNNNTLTEEAIWKAAHSDKELVKLGYLADGMPWTQGATIVCKTHNWPEPLNKTEAVALNRTRDWLVPFPERVPRRAVLLIRDPFKSFISVQKYSRSGSVRYDGDMKDLFHGPEWEKFISGYVTIWYEFYSRWILAVEDLHLVAYERLTQDPIGELAGILRYLSVEPDQSRMQCVRTHLEGEAHNRRHGTVPDNETYPLLKRAELWKHIHELNWLLESRNFTTLPLEKYSFVEEFGDARI